MGPRTFVQTRGTFYPWKSAVIGRRRGRRVRGRGIGSSPGCHVGTGTIGLGEMSDVLPASLGDAVPCRRRRGCRTVAGPVATGAGISSKGRGRIPTGTVEDREPRPPGR